MKVKSIFIVCCLIGVVLFTTSCGSIDVFEKTKPFGQHEWAGNDSASFSFDIKDTSSAYQLYFVLRHEDAYPKKNIWVDIKMKTPDSTIQLRREFYLADNTKWLGTAMDDIIEHRISINAAPIKLKKGSYTFTLKQVMREDPLPYVLNAGIRVEKAK